jgi:diaminohydroxyphosphoribosylaminopyrimidine deaminase/5-amino-6-(5-phosphoribosylamino)uracil reductase
MDDERFMRRALELSAIPLKTSPNPRVGAVIVRDGEIISEGFHEGRGNPHAEAVALAGVEASGSTVYVNLEPCDHHATTPPCTEALVRAGVARVVVAIEDPDVRVAGAGIARLKRDGIQVDVGVLEDEARSLNRAYIHQRVTGMPFITLKLAQTIDGRLAAPAGAGWITGAGARRSVHENRARVDAVMVGVGTVLADDPQLTARDVSIRTQPWRVVLDSAGRTPIDARVLGDDAPTIVITTDACPVEKHVALEDAGAEVIVVPRGDGGVDVGSAMKELGSREVVEILCEGGAELASSLLRGGYVQKLEIHTGPLVFGDGPQVTDLGVKSVTDPDPWHLVSAEKIGDDIIAAYEKWVP